MYATYATVVLSLLFAVVYLICLRVFLICYIHICKTGQGGATP